MFGVKVHCCQLVSADGQVCICLCTCTQRRVSNSNHFTLTDRWSVRPNPIDHSWRLEKIIQLKLPPHLQCFWFWKKLVSGNTKILTPNLVLESECTRGFRRTPTKGCRNSRLQGFGGLSPAFFFRVCFRWFLVISEGSFQALKQFIFH